MHNWFDLIQDKYNTPYFEDTEKDEFINRAQITLVNELIGENALPESEIIKPLILEDLTVATDGTDNSLILNADINTAIVVEANAGDEFLHILSLETAGSVFTTDRFVRFVRHNDYLKFKQNIFKTASDDNPLWRVVKDGIRVSGATTLSSPENFKLSVIKTPTDVNISGTDSEFPSFAHDKIVAIALELAGVATRDEVLALINKQQN